VALELLYWNFRCLGDDWKRSLTLETLNLISGTTDTILLTETKCKKKLEIVVDKNAFQTTLSSLGGAVALHSSSRAKLIKSLD
jgi:hypothetical protein